MVKVNTDENQRLAMQFNIQGIPAVKAFRNGQVVAEFVGAQPLNVVKSWLARLVPAPSAEALDRATAALKAGRQDEAEGNPAQAAGGERGDRPRRPAAGPPAAGDRPPRRGAPLLARIDRAQPRRRGDPRAREDAGFAEEAQRYGGEEKARAAVAANEKDLDARYALGSALAARRDFAGALDQFLEIVTRSRKFRDDAARLAMLAIFDHLGNDDDLTQDYRRRLQIVT
jgi:putative thioredoxin